MSVLFPVRPRPIMVGTDYVPREVLFVSDPHSLTVKSYLERYQGLDPEREAGHEVLKLSAIRRSKHARFVPALVLTLAFYLLILFVGIGLH